MSHPRSTNTSDPESEAARVFVGGVPPGADQDALEKMFEKHGKIKGVSVFKGEVEKLIFSVVKVVHVYIEIVVGSILFEVLK